MHSYEDYRTTYMARSDLGGGVILNQAIHEIDYLRFLFGEPDSVYAFGSFGNRTLNIDVDDCCDAILNFSGIPVVLHADFYQYPAKRSILVIGSKGSVEADLINNFVLVNINGEVKKLEYTDFTRNDMFIQELESFMYCRENNVRPEITLEDGIASLKIALSIKDSVLKKGEIIHLGEIV